MQMLTGNLAPTRGAISICGIDLFDEPTFRWLEFELVSRYRCYEDEQELIAATLSRLALCHPSPSSAERLEEMLAMLVHVHDPLI